MAITQKEVLGLIPLYQSGPNVGKPTNDRLRELQRMLIQFRYTGNELTMMHQEVLAAIPEKVHRRRAREAEEMR